MFDAPSAKPRVFGLPPGVDFPGALIDRLVAAHEAQPPDALARVQLIVNTRRMARRIAEIFDTGPARLLPRIGLVTDPGDTLVLSGLPAAVPALRQRLELTRLVAQLLEADPTLAPRAALYDLSDSLATLMEEMSGEGVDPAILTKLDVSGHAENWQRALRFLQIVQQFHDRSSEMPDQQARHRMTVTALVAEWQARPPRHPVIVAGSTGSRGTTLMLLEAVARLPQGAIVLPGFDFDMPAQAWEDLDDPLTAEDHPQFRFRILMNRLGLQPGDIRPWTGAAPSNPARNRLVSLALRPAPVTDRWLAEGPGLGDLAAAYDGLTLLEAPAQRDEALAIAMRLRQAAEAGQSATLITPDRMLTRQVTAMLDRWGILPDDSAGTPLHLTPPGRFLRHVAALFHRKTDAEQLITILSHPLTHSGAGRGAHLLATRELELYLRRKARPHPTGDEIRHWGQARGGADALWADWVADHAMPTAATGDAPLSDHVARHITLAERLAEGSQGTDGAGAGTLWQERPGLEARKVVEDLRREAPHGAAMSARDYADLFAAILTRAEVRDRDAPHPDIRILGTLEARVQRADLVILGGLNEGSWPELPPPDPWMNRKMRHEAGLLLPERRIGLSAHDFQQAIAGPEVWLTRAIRSDDAQTVPSRWLNRLLNLSNGLPASGGPAAVRVALARGARWLSLARAFETPERRPAAHRPAPRPPLAARPRQLSVTQIQTLIRDPYHIYARHVLRLRPLDPLMRPPDALLRGIALHAVMESFMRDVIADPAALNVGHLMRICDTVLAEQVAWADTRLMWRARMASAADWIIQSETTRLAQATPAALEAQGRASIPAIGFTLTAKADRIDRSADGGLVIYDYKTGTPPNANVQMHFDKQLLLEAAMAEQGAFDGIPAAPVLGAYFIGLKGGAADVAAPLGRESTEQVWQNLTALVASYLDPSMGFIALRASETTSRRGDYDHLARFGEWDLSDEPQPEDLT